MLQRDVTPHNRAFEQFMSDTKKKLSALHRKPGAGLDEQSDIRFGDAILHCETLPDDTVQVTMRNAITSGPPVLIATLE